MDLGGTAFQEDAFMGWNSFYELREIPLLWSGRSRGGLAAEPRGSALYEQLTFLAVGVDEVAGVLGVVADAIG